MAKVTVSLFGDKELEVDDSEVDVLRSQNILTSVEGVKEEDAPTGAPENVLPAAKLQAAGTKEEAKPSGSSAAK